MMHAAARTRHLAGAAALLLLLAGCGTGGDDEDSGDDPTAAADTAVGQEPADAGAIDPDAEGEGDVDGGADAGSDDEVSGGSHADGDEPAGVTLPDCAQIADTPAGTELLAGLELQDLVSGVNDVGGLQTLRCVWSSQDPVFNEVGLQLLIDSSGGTTNRDLAESVAVVTDDPRLEPFAGFVFTEDELDLDAPLTGGSSPVVMAGTARIMLSLSGDDFREASAAHTNDLAVQFGAEVLELL